MEVHHHPQVEKKRFKEYFLEFLMIFLAVTLGFFAENVREGRADHKKAEKFAASMKEDLKADTAQLEIYIKYYTTAANHIDTFMNLLSVNDPGKIPSGKLYWYGLFGGASSNFVPNDATFQAMKSSGAIGLFNPQTARDIEKYDSHCRLMQAADEMNQNLYAEVRKARAKIFDFKYNDIANHLFQKNKTSFNQTRIDSFMASNTLLLSHDKILFNQYVELVRSRFIRHYNVAYADSLLKEANVILNELNKD